MQYSYFDKVCIVVVVCLSQLNFLSSKQAPLMLANQRSNNQLTRIYGGFTAPPGYAPYQITLRYGPQPDFFYCSGELIDPCHALTAAHCFSLCTDLSCKVAYGSNNLTEQILIDVESFTPHEDFAEIFGADGQVSAILNDIAIVKVACGSQPEFDGCTVDKIDLVTEPVPCGSRFTTSGWGYTGADQVISQTLQETTMFYATPTDYTRKWEYFIDTYNLETGACSGDSGGPLIYNGKLAGLTSFGTACGDFVSFVGFTDVYKYTDWITNKINEMPCCNC